MCHVWHQRFRDERRPFPMPRLWDADLPVCEMPETGQPVRLPGMWVPGAVTMGDVAAQVKVMPTSPDVDLDDLEARLREALPAGAELTDVEHEDVAFGLVALVVMVIVPDDAGGTETVEAAFGELETVESVTVDSVTRL